MEAFFYRRKYRLQQRVAVRCNSVNYSRCANSKCEILWPITLYYIQVIELDQWCILASTQRYDIIEVAISTLVQFTVEFQFQLPFI